MTTPLLAACMVARDALEEGRLDEARKILDEQAPDRLDADCPACGAKVGKQCIEAGPLCDACRGSGGRVTLGRPLWTDPCKACGGKGRRVAELAIPHESRLLGRRR